MAPPPLSGPALAIQKVVQGSQKFIHTIVFKTKSSYRKIQSKVCDQLPDNLSCPENENDNIPLLAWQEKLLCRNEIPECLMTMTRRPKQESKISKEDL
jgi:hypothetical protein